MKKNSVIDVSDLFKQVKKVRMLLLKESDVGGVLISTSFLEACLASLLREHFKKSNVTKNLLKTSGVLGTFRSKCDVAYCLNLILEEMYKDLLSIGETRNIFAHNHLASFKDDNVHEICSKLNAPGEYLEANQDQSNYEDVKEYYERPKNRFVYTVTNISELLLQTILSEQSRNIRNGSKC